MNNLKIYQVKMVNLSNRDQVDFKAVVAEDMVSALTAQEIPQGWEGVEAVELYHAPLDVMEIMPVSDSAFIKIRSAIGWVMLPLVVLLNRFDQGLNYIDEGVCTEAGAMLHVRFVFTAQQIAQTKDYL
jgi:hypothetical protein